MGFTKNNTDGTIIHETGVVSFPEKISVGTDVIRSDETVHIDGYLFIDSAASDACVEMGDGYFADVSLPNEGRIRYNIVTQQFEVSTDGNPYVGISTGPQAGPWNEGAGVVYPDYAAWDVAIGDSIMFDTEKLRVVGDIAIQGGIVIEDSVVDPAIYQYETAGAGNTLYISAQETTTNNQTAGDLQLLGGDAPVLAGGSTGGNVILIPGVGDTPGYTSIQTSIGGELFRLGSDGVINFSTSATSITASGNPTFNFGTSLSTFGGDVDISGKLTVDGYIDPVAMIIESAGNDAFLEMGAGQLAGRSQLGEGRIRYNDLSHQFELSTNNDPYVAISTGGSTSPWTELGGQVYTNNSSWNVSLGISTQYDQEKLRVYGESIFETADFDDVPVTIKAGPVQNEVLLELVTDTENTIFEIDGYGGVFWGEDVPAPILTQETNAGPGNATNLTIQAQSMESGGLGDGGFLILKGGLGDGVGGAAGAVIVENVDAGAVPFTIQGSPGQSAGYFEISDGYNIIFDVADDISVGCGDIVPINAPGTLSNLGISGGGDEWGSIYLSDDQEIVFGTTQDIRLYHNSASHHLEFNSNVVSETNDAFQFYATVGDANFISIASLTVTRSAPLTGGNVFTVWGGGVDGYVGDSSDSAIVVYGALPLNTPSDANIIRFACLPFGLDYDIGLLLPDNVPIHLGSDISSGSQLWHDGYGVVTNSNTWSFGGDVDISGKLTVDGYLDPPAVIIEDKVFGDGAFFEMKDGSGAGISSSDEGRIRYNQAEQRWEMSANANPYEPIGGASTSPWSENAGVIYPTTHATDDVVIGTNAMVGTERFYVYGDSAFGASATFPTVGSIRLARGGNNGLYSIDSGSANVQLLQFDLSDQVVLGGTGPTGPADVVIQAGEVWLSGGINYSTSKFEMQDDELYWADNIGTPPGGPYVYQEDNTTSIARRDFTIIAQTDRITDGTSGWLKLAAGGDTGYGGGIGGDVVIYGGLSDTGPSEAETGGDVVLCQGNGYYTGKIRFTQPAAARLGNPGADIMVIDGTTIDMTGATSILGLPAGATAWEDAGNTLYPANNEDVVIGGTDADGYNLRVVGDAKFNSDVYIDGKLTVDGYIDPIGIILEDYTGDGAFIQMADGQAADVSSSDEGRIVYNASNSRFEMSVDGSSYQEIPTGSIEWTRSSDVLEPSTSSVNTWRFDVNAGDVVITQEENPAFSSSGAMLTIKAQDASSGGSTGGMLALKQAAGWSAGAAGPIEIQDSSGAELYTFEATGQLTMEDDYDFVPATSTHGQIGTASSKFNNANLSAYAAIGASNLADAGAVRLSNNTGIYGRNSGNSANILLVSTNATDDVVIGDSSTSVELGADLHFDDDFGPNITQNDRTGNAAWSMGIKAQSVTGGGDYAGGSITIEGGNGQGTGSGGDVNITTGTPGASGAAGTIDFSIDSTKVASFTEDGTGEYVLEFNRSNDSIIRPAGTSSANGDDIYLQGGTTTFTNADGGNAIIDGGRGDGTGDNGYVECQSGGTRTLPIGSHTRQTLIAKLVSISGSSWANLGDEAGVIEFDPTDFPSAKRVVKFGAVFKRVGGSASDIVHLRLREVGGATLSGTEITTTSDSLTYVEVTLDVGTDIQNSSQIYRVQAKVTGDITGEVENAEMRVSYETS